MGSFSPPSLLPHLTKTQLTARHNQLLTSNPSHLGYLWTCPKAAGWKPSTSMEDGKLFEEDILKKLRPVSWDAAHAKHLKCFQSSFERWFKKRLPHQTSWPSGRSKTTRSPRQAYWTKGFSPECFSIHPLYSMWQSLLATHQIRHGNISKLPRT